MALLQDNSRFEQAVGKALHIDMHTAKAGTLSAEYTSGEKDVKVTWQCVKYVPVAQFNEIMEHIQR